MTEDTNCFDGSNFLGILDMIRCYFLLESLRKLLVKDQTAAKDVVPILIREDKAEKLRLTTVCLQLDSRRKAEVTDALWKWVVVPVLAIWGISIDDPCLQLPLHDVSGLEAEESIQVTIFAHAIENLLVSFRYIPVDSGLLVWKKLLVSSNDLPCFLVHSVSYKQGDIRDWLRPL